MNATATVTRRKFLRLSAGALGTAAMIGGPGLAYRLAVEPETISHPAWLESGSQSQVVPTICSLCPSGCGMLARIVDGNLVKLEGNPMHPVNLGALCPKGQAAPELLYNPDRLTGPMRRAGARGAGQWQPISWDEALALVVARLAELRQAGHPERVALLYGETRGQMRGFLTHVLAAVGSPNAISHDSLNLEAARLGLYLTQGIYDLPAYDLENSNYVLSFGANLLEAGRSPQRTIAGYSYLRRGRADRGKVVMIDPRQGITGAKADEWIPIVPGTDGALALALAHVIIKTGQFDSDFVHNYAFGFDDFKDDQGRPHKGFKNYVLENYDPRRVEQITGVPATTIGRLAGEFAGNPPAVAMLPAKGGLLNGSLNGLAAAMAIHSLNALVGSLERPGGVLTQRYPACPPWPALPPDPIAEAGRQAERLDGAGTLFPLGHHAYQAVADRILAGYPVELLLLYDANPVYEVPGGERFAAAFEKVPLVVSFASFMDESAQLADLVLPEPTFLERWQDDYIEGLGYPGIGLRQPVVPPLYNTRHTGDFLLQVGHKLGDPVAQALPWETFPALLQERLQAIGTEWETLAGLGVWLTPGYRFARRGDRRWLAEVVGAQRELAPRDGRFDFFSRELFCLLGERSRQELDQLGAAVSGDALYLPHDEPVRYAGEVENYPFLLNIVTLMSLGAHSYNANLPSLQEISGMTVRQSWASWLEMNPESAAGLGLADGDRVRVESPFGRLQTRLKLVPGLRPDVVNMPYNQGHQAVGRFAAARGSHGFALLNPASEPFTGLAALTNTRVRVFAA